MRGRNPGFLQESRGGRSIWSSEGKGTTIFTGTVDGTIMSSFELHVELTAHTSGRRTVRGVDHGQSKRGV